MANNIRNLQKLSSDELATTYFTARFQTALDMTMKEFLKKLDDMIDADVYGWHSKSSEPWEQNRTFQFKKSWEYTKSEIINNIVESEIEQNVSIMRQFDIGGRTVHEDAENLAEIINTGNDYNFGQMTREPESRPYWDEFKHILDGNLDRIFLENCRKLGIDIK